MAWQRLPGGLLVETFPGQVQAAISGARGKWTGLVWRAGDPSIRRIGPYKTQLEAKNWAAYHAGIFARP